MAFAIRMGIPEMKTLWDKLQSGYRNQTNHKEENQLYKKWGKALKLLSENPRHPGLRTHEIPPLTRRYGLKVWQ